MGIGEILILAVGLAMDAFAVSICKGLSIGRIRLKNCVYVGLWFGGFQALMPVIGYYLGINFKDMIEAVDHWIAFCLLALIGANMIREAFSRGDDKVDGSLSFKNMLISALATSIDALAIGITLAFLDVSIWLAITIIGIVTFILSGVGVKFGSMFGEKYKSKAELAGGIILILLGTKILLDHLGVL